MCAKHVFFGSLLYVRMRRTKQTKKTTNNIGIAASGVAGATAIISADFFCCYIGEGGWRCVTCDCDDVIM